MSFGGSAKKSKSKTDSSENIVQQQTLDPLARSALEQVITGAKELQSTNAPIVAGFDPSTTQGINQLASQGASPFVGTGAQTIDDVLSQQFLQSSQVDPALSQISATAAGDFQGHNPSANTFNPALEAVRERIQQAATRSVADRFAQAGRSGSPAEGLTLSKTVARELAPFEFSALQQNQQLQNQNFENERQRQLAASSLGLNQFNQGLGTIANFASLAPGFDSLLSADAKRKIEAGQLRQQQAQNELDVPFLRFERFANPLIAAAGGLPVGLTRQGQSSSKTKATEISVGGGFSL